MPATTAYSLTATVACRFAAAATRAPAEWSNAMGVDGARVAVAGRDGAEADAVDEQFASVWHCLGGCGSQDANGGAERPSCNTKCDATPPTATQSFRPRSPTQNFAGVFQST